MSKSSQSNRPSSGVWIIALIAIGQAIALLVNAVLTITDPKSHELPGAAIFFLVFLYVLGAAWLLAAANGVIKGKAWPRGSLIVVEILAIILSFTYFQLGEIVLGLALLISGAVVLICLFTPALSTHMVQRRSK